MVIEQTGTYVDKDGNTFWYREGSVAPDGMTLRPEAGKKAGAPENRAERPAETRGHGRGARDAERGQ